MYSDRIYLTAQQILDHEFKIDTRGYNPQEVDKFLDMVIRDYTEYNNIIKDLEAKLQNASDDNSLLKSELRHAQDDLEKVQNELANAPKSVNNIDLLKRISKLEKAVFGENETL